jgi:hypothetical protein
MSLMASVRSSATLAVINRAAQVLGQPSCSCAGHQRITCPVGVIHPAGQVLWEQCQLPAYACVRCCLAEAEDLRLNGCNSPLQSALTASQADCCSCC